MNAAAEQIDPGSERPTQRRRRYVPAGVYMESGVAGRVLVFLWSMAPWSQGPVAFVWPKLDTIAQALDLWPSQVGKAIKRLRDVGWIRRETRSVRFEGRMVDRLGFVLLEEPSAGPLFDWLRREDEQGEVVVAPPSKVVEPQPPRVVVASLEEQGSIKKSSSPRAQEREPGEDDEESAAPITPRNPPTPRPTPPPDDPRPAAIEREIWDEHEQLRHARLGGLPPRPLTPQRIDEIRELLRHVQVVENTGDAGARLQVFAFLHLSIANAREQVRVGGPWAQAFCSGRLRAPFSTTTYDAVMARASVDAVRHKIKIDSEWTPEPDPLPREESANGPAMSIEEIGQIFEAFTASTKRAT